MSDGTVPACDAVLLRRAHAGDGVAFAALYDRHAAAAYRVAVRLLPSRATAEDVVQDAFLTLWRTTHFDAAQGSVRSYLLAIVHNRAVDRLRKDRRRQADSPLDEGAAERLPADEHTDAEVERREIARVLRTSVSELPDAQRATLELAYFAGLTQHEIAALQREPLGTVKGRIRLALKKLGVRPEVVACR